MLPILRPARVYGQRKAAVAALEADPRDRLTCRKVFPRTICEGVALCGTCIDPTIGRNWTSGIQICNQKLGPLAFSLSSHTGREKFATGPSPLGSRGRPDMSPCAAVLHSSPPPRPPGPSGRGNLFGVGAIATHAA